MTFIGIAIFTIYTKVTVYVGACDPAFSTSSVCASYEKSEQQEDGRQEPRYVGEFSSIDDCGKAVDAAQYKPKPGERVDQTKEILCVPKGGEQ